MLQISSDEMLDIGEMQRNKGGGDGVLKDFQILIAAL